MVIAADAQKIVFSIVSRINFDIFGEIKHG
jgi:hypothetical protein